ncbi:hypothetical protein [Roseobacter sp. CCS2]|uniref:hypothetical protein n=1 Tax=Roseobacter sp. CCS2 TaxID=391593 RepID=UPI0000F3E453|nr:hypothetical protein [Roseobacter sp. CCS2]EBA12649.1 hypothetical protein RCCS2_15169 [Roseobacter sp. CCS2]
MDEFAELFGNLIGLVIIFMMVAVAIMFIGMVVAPIALIGGGGLYYAYNIYLPEKLRREARERTEALYKRAQALSPSHDDLIMALLDVGIDSIALHRIAKTLYMQEGLQPPILPPVGDETVWQRGRRQ